jgi:hypothetical protein
MNSKFTNKAQDAVDERRNRQPSYSVGFLVSTADIVQQAITNPWFLSINQMVPMLADNSVLVRDSIKNGVSAVGPDYERPESRKPWTYVSLLVPGIQGTASGKLQGLNMWSTQSEWNFLHMLANRKETPTGISVEQRTAANLIDSNTQFSPQDTVNNAPPVSNLSATESISSTSSNLETVTTSVNGVTKVITRVKEIKSLVDLTAKQAESIFQGPSQNHTSSTSENGVTKVTTQVKQPITVPLNPMSYDMDDQGKKKRTKATNTGSQGTRIQTGTHLISGSQMGALLGLVGGIH